MSARMLNDILKTLTENGFKACVFANTDGLILASAKASDINEKIIAAMIALMTESAMKTKEEMNLDNFLEMVIKYKDASMYCRQITIPNSPTIFLLAALAPPSTTEEIEKYNTQLVTWAVDNAMAPLKKLVDL